MNFLYQKSSVWARRQCLFAKSGRTFVSRKKCGRGHSAFYLVGRTNSNSAGVVLILHACPSLVHIVGNAVISSFPPWLDVEGISNCLISLWCIWHIKYVSAFVKLWAVVYSWRIKTREVSHLLCRFSKNIPQLSWITLDEVLAHLCASVSSSKKKGEPSICSIWYSQLTYCLALSTFLHK